ncbi:hypothetical protein ACHAXM_002294 [Skeletonema potamos]
MAEAPAAAAAAGGGGNDDAANPPNQQIPTTTITSRRRTLKLSILVILLCVIIFLSSFNASMRHLIAAQKKETKNNRKGSRGGNRDKHKQKSAHTKKDFNSYSDGNHDNNNNHDDDDLLYKTTIRPLDGYLEKRTHLLPVRNPANSNNNNDDETTTTTATNNKKQQREQLFHETTDYILRPTVQSYNRQSQYYKTPTSSSTSTAADAHFAKAIRMLSSPFDKLVNGGNALPSKVYGGSYHGQSVEDGKYGRGEGFVKLVVEEQQQQPPPGGRRRRYGGGNNRRRGLKRGRERRGGDDNSDDDDGRLRDMIQDYILDTIDWLLFEIMGVEMDEMSTTSSSSLSEMEYDYNDNKNEDYDNDDDGNSIINIRMLLSRKKKNNEEDVYSWRDTRVGSQLVWMYSKVVGSLWSRDSSESLSSSSSPSMNYADTFSSSSSSSPTTSSTTFSGNSETTKSLFLSKEDELAREGLYHLEKAADLGHAEAQRMLANSLASGILPISDHGLVRRIAAWQYAQKQQQKQEGSGGGNWTEILRQSSLQVPDDFSSGGEQLARAIMLWHISAMDGNIESAMALGYRHLYSATGGVSTSVSDVIEGRIASRYNPLTGKGRDQHGSNPTSHYGVLGTCETALAYYEAAANGIMDTLEAGPTRGKINPPLDEHRLAEIYMHGGASVSLQGYNKPDEIEEALQYYRMLASRNHSPEPDLGAALTIANFYYFGLRGVKQQLRLALKYYEICGDYNNWEGGGQAGLMHFWGVGMSHDERDLHKAYSYFLQGTPGGLEGCSDRVRRRKKALNKKDSNGEEISLCDKHSINGMGLMNLFGVEGLVERNVAMARSWWELCKDMGDPDCQYNYGMLRLGWMVTELKDLKSVERFAKDAKEPKSEEVFLGEVKTGKETNYMTYRKAKAEDDLGAYTGPSATDYSVAIQEFSRAAAKGHLQAKHKIAMLYSTGVEIPKKEGKTSTAVTQSCTNSLRYYKSIADGGDTISRRNRAAWKQYNAGDYESALRNYLATAETGSETGQVNAAFLLEQGHCLGLTRDSCTRASVRLWRAAARQGNLEACLRVGDYYYYGRMKKSRGGQSTPPIVVEDGNSKFLYEQEELEGKAFYFVPGPYRWARYILYPEELFQLAKNWAAKYFGAQHNTSKKEDEDDSGKHTCSIDDEALGTCKAAVEDDAEEDDEDHMAIAAQYYRKAAEEHKSARANFNLGFMHEWGLGLTQDFPLAKRHYDLAGEEASIASSIALWAMSVHQRVVKFTMILDGYYGVE